MRVAELPDAAADGGFGRSCAMRLRDDESGREYLLVKSEIQTAENNVGGIAIKKLASAAGDYALIRAEPSADPAAELRVDCTTSRVVAVLAPGA